MSLSILRASSSYRWAPSGQSPCNSTSLMEIRVRTGRRATRRTAESICRAASARNQSQGVEVVLLGLTDREDFRTGRLEGVGRGRGGGGATAGRVGRKGRRGAGREAADTTKDKASVRALPRRVGGETCVAAEHPAEAKHNYVTHYRCSKPPSAVRVNPLRSCLAQIIQDRCTHPQCPLAQC